MASSMQSASHCFDFEQDFIGNWRCIPLCVRRKLDLSGVKLKLDHWLALTQDQRQQLVDWPDTPDALQDLRDHLRERTASMPSGCVKDLPPSISAPWQQADHLPPDVADAAAARGVTLTPSDWRGIRELDRFALCKLVRPGHDHHNLTAAFSEVLG